MYSTDPIADMLTRIRNALMRQKDQAIIPYSEIKLQIASVFEKYKFIARLKVEGEGKNKIIVIDLTDDKLAISPITELKKISRPGRRVYAGWQEIPRIKNGRGLVVMSTDQGIITGFEANQKKIGGEIICSIY